MWPTPQFPADLVTFVKDILNRNLNLLCSGISVKGFNVRCPWKDYKYLNKAEAFLRIWSHLLKKSFMENFIFSAVVFLLSSLTPGAHEKITIT